MSNTIKILRNSAYSLIFYALASVFAHFIYAVIDFNKGSLTINVVRNAPVSKQNIKGFNFTNSGVGKIQLRPSVKQSLALENQIFDDGGAGVVFFLTLGSAILLAIRFGLINMDRLEEQNIYQLLVIVMFLFLAISIGGITVMDEYVGNLTGGSFKHDHTHGFSSLYSMGLIVLANATYQFIVYTRKLKQENDLTI